MATDILTRFFNKIETIPECGCWVWTAYTDKDGYGIFTENGKRVKAHRFSYETHKNKIPSNQVIDHKCRVRCCVNPDHLEPVTNHENIKRGNVGGKFYRERTHCNNGHEFTEENTGIRNGKWRYCRICNRARTNASRRAKALAAADNTN